MVELRTEVILISLFFVINFTAYASAQNIISELYLQQGHTVLSTITVFTIYLTMTLTSFFANQFLHSFSYKRIIIVSAFGYLSLMLSGIYVSSCQNSSQYICTQFWLYSVTLMAAILNGVGGTFIWAGCSAYIQFLCTRRQVEQKGIYFGIFYGIYSSCQIFGALVTTFALNFFQHTTYFMILSSLCLTAVVFGSIFMPPDQLEQRKKWVFSEAKPISLRVKDYVRLIKSDRMKSILPCMILVGVGISMFSVTIHKLVQQSTGINPSDISKRHQLNFKTGLVLLALGVGAISGGYMSGLGGDWDIAFSTRLSIIMNEIAIVLSIVCFQTKQYSICFFCGFMWGFAESYLQNTCILLCSKLLKGQVQAFVLNKQVQSGMCCLMILLQTLGVRVREVLLLSGMSQGLVMISTESIIF